MIRVTITITYHQSEDVINDLCKKYNGVSFKISNLVHCYITFFFGVGLYQVKWVWSHF